MATEEFNEDDFQDAQDYFDPEIIDRILSLKNNNLIADSSDEEI